MRWAKTITTEDGDFSIEHIINHLEPGDLIEDNGVHWICIAKVGYTAVVQQYNRIKDHVFNENGSNVYEGSDLQRYVREEVTFTVSEEFRSHMDGDFFILSEDKYENMPFLQEPKNRIRLNEHGMPTWHWTASPLETFDEYVCGVHATGAIGIQSADRKQGVAPTCNLRP